MDYEHPLIALPIVAAAALAAYLTIWKRLIIPIYRFFRRMAHILERLNDEFAANGGGTMRDAINDIQARVERLEGPEKG